MRRHLTRLTWFCAVLCLSLPVGTTRAQDDPPPAAAAEARRLEGKLV